MEYTAKNPVASDLTLLSILETMEEHGGCIGFNELVDQVDVTKGTVHNHLSTLRQRGYVTADGDTYCLGLRFLRLGEGARSRNPVFEVGRTQIDKLARETGELANLATHERGHGVYLYRVQGDPNVQFATDAGVRHDLHCSATGKAMLAYTPPSELDRILDARGLEARTEHSITTRAELDAELERVREEGLAFDLEEYEVGLHCVGAPVLDSDNRAAGAISVSGPATRFSGEYFGETLAEAVRETANVVSLNLNRIADSS